MTYSDKRCQKVLLEIAMILPSAGEHELEEEVDEAEKTPGQAYRPFQRGQRDAVPDAVF